MMNMGRSIAAGTVRKASVLQFGKLTWVGLMIAALGWAMLLSGVSLADIINRLTGHASPAATSLNMGLVAQSTILTGFAIAILGLLQTGFSALNRFFDSVLERTAKRQELDQGAVPLEARSHSARAPMPNHKPAAAALKTRGKIVERGLLKDRAYVLFGDGSIEVETLLGLRRFPSLREAAEFIG
jgi:hypothetical protein